jgi:uncharacterized protein YbjT (DUF2867 family)
MNNLRSILVLGGTGFVGRAVCEMLVQRGDGGGGRIIVPTRRLMRASALRALPTTDLRQADIHDDETLKRLVGKADAVINLVGTLHGSAAEFERVHVALPRRLAAACELLGVRRVLHVSALGAASDAPSNYLRSKAGGEAALRNAALDLTLFRPSVVFGASDHLLNLFAGLQAVFPVLPLAAADARFQPVWVDDVARAVVRCLDQPETIGRSYELVGPEVVTLSEIARRAGRWSGHERHQIALPPFVARLQAALMAALPGPPLLSKDNLDTMRVPSVAGGTLPGLEALGILPAPMEAVVPGYLGTEGVRRRLARWRANARRA